MHLLRPIPRMKHVFTTRVERAGCQVRLALRTLVSTSKTPYIWATVKACLSFEGLICHIHLVWCVVSPHSSMDGNLSVKRFWWVLGYNQISKLFRTLFDTYPILSYPILSFQILFIASTGFMFPLVRQKLRSRVQMIWTLWIRLGCYVIYNVHILPCKHWDLQVCNVLSRRHPQRGQLANNAIHRKASLSSTMLEVLCEV